MPAQADIQESFLAGSPLSAFGATHFGGLEPAVARTERRRVAGTSGDGPSLRQKTARRDGGRRFVVGTRSCGLSCRHYRNRRMAPPSRASAPVQAQAPEQARVQVPPPSASTSWAQTSSWPSSSPSSQPVSWLRSSLLISSSYVPNRRASPSLPSSSTSSASSP